MAYYKSVNPYTQQTLKTYTLHSSEDVETFKKESSEAQRSSEFRSLSFRLSCLSELIKNLRLQKEQLAMLISQEMGKVFTESQAEIDKCLWLCEYYLSHSEAVLRAEKVDLGTQWGEKRKEALGLILGVMPWNFPFWQVFRFAVPAILSGNAVFLKHAPNVPQCAEAIEKLFEAFPSGIFRNIRLKNETVENLIKAGYFQGLSLTGSTRAGRKLGKLAGEAIIPQVLELGGSNAMVVFPDADLDHCLDTAVTARLMNAGQSCIAAKRFIVHEDILKPFERGLKERFESLQLGDPMSEKTQVGPLARPDLAENLARQLRESVEQGAEIVCGGRREGTLFYPTILNNVRPSMPVFREETFGPLACIVPFSSVEEAIALSNKSEFGLGVSLFGGDVAALLEISAAFEEGAVFINDLVKSDPRMPFGGIKASGVGRELGSEGLLSFCNIKSCVYPKTVS